MPGEHQFRSRDLSKEWEYWRSHYRSKGCGENKVKTLSHRKMRKLYGVG